MVTEKTTPLRVLLVGCGALAELYYRPVLKHLEERGELRLVQIMDPDPGRREAFQQSFPGVRAHDSLSGVTSQAVDLGIVCSPAAYHASQVQDLLGKGIHVLCEKPMAANLDQARAMVLAAQEAERLLAVGYLRRQFATSRFVKETLESGALGRLLRLDWVEGGLFNWPAASPSFFQRSSSSGGVWSDMGSHVVDLVSWWLGTPDQVNYQDDAMGGLENNCRVGLQYPGGVQVSIRLSRDSALTTGTRMEFERGTLSWCGAEASHLDVALKGNALALHSHLTDSVRKTPCANYSQAFTLQLLHVCRRIRGRAAWVVEGKDALPGMQILEDGYRSRKLMKMPWLEDFEWESASART